MVGRGNVHTLTTLGPELKQLVGITSVDDVTSLDDGPEPWWRAMTRTSYSVALLLYIQPYEKESHYMVLEDEWMGRHHGQWERKRGKVAGDSKSPAQQRRLTYFICSPKSIP